MEENIKQALVELRIFNLSWQEKVQKQLEFCLEVISGKVSPDKLEELNMGLVAIRELGENEVLYSLLTKIQYEMQQNYLPYAAKVRLNIHQK